MRLSHLSRTAVIAAAVALTATVAACGSQASLGGSGAAPSVA
jgi:hypothetical protein